MEATDPGVSHISSVYSDSAVQCLDWESARRRSITSCSVFKVHSTQLTVFPSVFGYLDPFNLTLSISIIVICTVIL